MRRLPARDKDDLEPSCRGAFEARPDHEERMFLALVLKEGIKEYLPPKETKRNRAKRAMAHKWIFDVSDYSRAWVFGFEFICNYLGIDPGQARARIIRLREGDNRRVLYKDSVHIDRPAEPAKKPKEV